jgi:hypothetical protein
VKNDEPQQGWPSFVETLNAHVSLLALSRNKTSLQDFDSENEGWVPRSPLWSRRYSSRSFDSGLCEEVAALLRMFRVSRIIVGHSPQANHQPLVRCDGQMIVADITLSRGFKDGGQPGALVLEVAHNGTDLDSMEMHFTHPDDSGLRASVPLWPIAPAAAVIIAEAAKELQPAAPFTAIMELRRFYVKRTDAGVAAVARQAIVLLKILHEKDIVHGGDLTSSLAGQLDDAGWIVAETLGLINWGKARLWTQRDRPLPVQACDHKDVEPRRLSPGELRGECSNPRDDMYRLSEALMKARTLTAFGSRLTGLSGAEWIEEKKSWKTGVPIFDNFHDAMFGMFADGKRHDATPEYDRWINAFSDV